MFTCTLVMCWSIYKRLCVLLHAVTCSCFPVHVVYIVSLGWGGGGGGGGGAGGKSPPPHRADAYALCAAFDFILTKPSHENELNSKQHHTATISFVLTQCTAQMSINLG